MKAKNRLGFRAVHVLRVTSSPKGRYKISLPYGRFTLSNERVESHQAGSVSAGQVFGISVWTTVMINFVVRSTCRQLPRRWTCVRWMWPLDERRMCDLRHWFCGRIVPKINKEQKATRTLCSFLPLTLPSPHPKNYASWILTDKQCTRLHTNSAGPQPQHLCKYQ